MSCTLPEWAEGWAQSSGSRVGDLLWERQVWAVRHLGKWAMLGLAGGVLALAR